MSTTWREIAFDPHLAQQTMNNLGEDGLPVCRKCAQGLGKRWAPAVKELEAGHPWAQACHTADIQCSAGMYRTSPSRPNKAGNKTFSQGQVEGPDRWARRAAAMAVGRASHGEGGNDLQRRDGGGPEGLLYV